MAGAIFYDPQAGFQNYSPTLGVSGNTSDTNYLNGTPDVSTASLAGNTGSTSNLGSATYTQGVNDPNTLASYQQAINNTQAQYDRQGNLLNSGYSTIDASYQNALNQLLGNKNQGQATYNDNKLNTALDYSKSKNTIGTQAGESLNGLQRLLGSRGAGGSSAYLQAVPQAVARGASLQRGEAANQFGSNNRSLDQGWGTFLKDYNNQVSSAGSQKDQQRQGLQQSIDTNRASLLQTLAQLQSQYASAAGGNGTTAAQPYLDQANGILDNLSNYKTAPISYNAQAYQAPSLSSYQTQANPTPQINGNGGDYFSPFLQTLLGKKQQQVA